MPRSSFLCCWGALLEAALILYLAIQGRMPTRVLWLVFLPFMALVAGLLPSCIPAVRLRFVRVAATVGALLWGAVRLWADARRGHTAFTARYRGVGSHRGSGSRFG